jgi:hypothetical protein
MSLLYLTLFILYMKGSIILHNKVFLLTELPLPPSLNFHNFFTWFSNLNVVLCKNVVTFFSSTILIQLHNLIQLNFTCINTLAISPHLFFLFTRTMKLEQSVRKHRHIKFRRRGITQKKEYNIHNTAKVWNQVRATCSHFTSVFFTAIFYADTMYIRPIQWRKRTTCYMNVVKSQPPSPRHQHPQNFLTDDCNKTVLKTDLEQWACRMKTCNTCFLKLGIFYNKRVVKLRASSKELFWNQDLLQQGC